METIYMSIKLFVGALVAWSETRGIPRGVMLAQMRQKVLISLTRG